LAAGWATTDGERDLYKVTKNGQTQVMVHTPSNKFISATKWHQIFNDARRGSC